MAEARKRYEPLISSAEERALVKLGKPVEETNDVIELLDVDVMNALKRLPLQQRQEMFGHQCWPDRIDPVVAQQMVRVERVRHRVAAGGHDVPETKIRERHRRLAELVAQAITLADGATVYDNSRLAGPRIVAQFSGGGIIGRACWPSWTPPPLMSRWSNRPETA